MTFLDASVARATGRGLLTAATASAGHLLAYNNWGKIA